MTENIMKTLRIPKLKRDPPKMSETTENKKQQQPNNEEEILEIKDESSDNENDAQNGEDNESGGGGGIYLRLRGLPWSATHKSILEFLKNVKLADGQNSIHLVTSRQDGKNTGEAYVEVATEQDAEEARKLHKCSMGHRYIEVFEASEDEAKASKRKSAMHGDVNVVKLRGLPYSVSEREIRDFFKGLEIKSGREGILFVFDRRGRASGEGFVQFETAEDTEQALGHNREKIGHRYIEIFRSTQAEMKRAAGGASNRSAPYDIRDRGGNRTTSEIWSGGNAPYNNNGGGGGGGFNNNNNQSNLMNAGSFGNFGNFGGQRGNFDEDDFGGNFGGNRGNGGNFGGAIGGSFNGGGNNGNFGAGRNFNGPNSPPGPFGGNNGNNFGSGMGGFGGNNAGNFGNSGNFGGGIGNTGNFGGPSNSGNFGGSNSGNFGGGNTGNFGGNNSGNFGGANSGGFGVGGRNTGNFGGDNGGSFGLSNSGNFGGNNAGNFGAGNSGNFNGGGGGNSGNFGNDFVPFSNFGGRNNAGGNFGGSNDNFGANNFRNNRGGNDNLPIGGGNNFGPAGGNNDSFFVVHMRGLPYSAFENEICKFFQELRPANVRVNFNAKGLHDGTADAYFNTYEDAQDALKFNREKMGSRYIELFYDGRGHPDDAPPLGGAPRRF